MRIQNSLNKSILLASLYMLVSCGGGTSGGSIDDDVNENTTDQRKIITDVGEIMQTGFLKLGTSITSLNTKVVDYCDALGTSEEQANRLVAQDSFKTAMSDLQASLLHSVGPSLEQDRMLQLYSWPLSSPCQIDLKLANSLPSLNIAVNKRGLDALEYLLFVEPNANNSCPSSTTPVPADLLDNFDALNTAEKQQRRCNFMIPVAADAQASAMILADAWDNSKGNYLNTLTETSNTKETLNRITDAMFYFEEVVKENKLDAPLGGAVTNASSICGLGNLCPEAVESPHARTSKENVRANMLAFQALYLAGFDGWLKDEGKDVLAQSFGGSIQAVIDDIGGIGGDFHDAVTNDTTLMNNLLNGSVQDVSRALRFDVLLALGLDLPAGSQSDTD